MFNLEGKKILITGATGGIGRSLVENFYTQKSLIIATGTNEEKISRLKKDFTNIKTIKFTLDKHDQIENFINEVYNQFDGLDVVINNAGITRDNLSLRMKEEDWKKVLDINLTSTFLICKYSLKIMLKQKKGKIINITSIVGHTGNFGQSNYTATKAGVVAFSKSLSLEYAKKNININCISPGFIKTPMTEDLSEEQVTRLQASIPIGRLGEAEDVAAAVVYLASSEASYVTGATLNVNGGMAMP